MRVMDNLLWIKVSGACKFLIWCQNIALQDNDSTVLQFVLIQQGNWTFEKIIDTAKTPRVSEWIKCCSTKSWDPSRASNRPLNPQLCWSEAGLDSLGCLLSHAVNAHTQETTKLQMQKQEIPPALSHCHSANDLRPNQLPKPEAGSRVTPAPC